MLRKILNGVLKYLNRKVNAPDWKNLRSTTPLSGIFGYDRGNQSVHRFYIDKFIDTNADKISGAVLEVGDDMYTNRYKQGILDSSIIHFTEINNNKAFIGDLTINDTLPASKFDCFICTQTFNFIYDFQQAIKGSHYLLKSGGYLVATVSGIQQLSKFDAIRWGDYWRFTDQACLKAFSDVFGKDNVKITAYGNVLSCVAALEGLASSELSIGELDYNDPAYQLIIGILAKKA